TLVRIQIWFVVRTLVRIQIWFVVRTLVRIQIWFVVRTLVRIHHKTKFIAKFGCEDFSPQEEGLKSSLRTLTLVLRKKD
ncbi:hypothetical protein, partial [Microcoleus sp. CAWBG27]|uniref:hypothetical protein n=1 Tax=Microcoleus sp. CAWBG27 TaxID=2841645 RepID=UPI0025D96B64